MTGKNIIIIGGGPAGLSAAYRLLKADPNLNVTVVEATDKLGGISRTDEHNGNRMDIGGHRFFTKNDEVREFWNTIMPLQGSPAYDDLKLKSQKALNPDGPDPEKEDRVMLLRRRVSRIYFLRKFFDYPISLSGKTIKAMGFSNTMKVGFGYLKACVFKRPEVSLEDFYINRFGKPLYEMFFEDYTEKVWGVHPSKISKEWGAQRVKGLSLMKALGSMIKKAFGKKDTKVETSLIEEYFYPKKGPGQLWEAVADDVRAMGGHIMMNTECIRFSHSDGRLCGATLKTGSSVYDVKADTVFSSMPVKELVRAIPDAPDDVRTIAEGLPYRDFITVGLLVKKLAIKNETDMKTLGNIVPDCWIYVQERDVKLGRIQIFNNWSPYMVKQPDDTVWMGLEYFCTEGDAMWCEDENEFIHKATGEVAKIGIIDESDVLDSTCVKIKKAYPAYFGTYAEFGKVRKYLDTFENLYCIGRNGQHRYNNMDHSMLTAFTAVRAYFGQGTKEDVWRVNTEEEFHEEKKSN